MNQSNHQFSNNITLKNLVPLALDQLKQLGYSKKSIYRYKTTWKYLIEFSHQEQLGDTYSEELVACFLKEHLLEDGKPIKSLNGWQNHMIFSIKVLRDFVCNGYIERSIIYTQNIDIWKEIQSRRCIK
ncbi:MAG: hypothetical protein QNL62_02560 [Gammaproteobacteria bacterium]|nr:hypothetical protein [Gammaproteobacteria bacterium]